MIHVLAGQSGAWRHSGLRTGAIKMEADQPLSDFDRWRERCFATLENGVVVSCPNQAEWIEWMRENFSAGNHLIAKNDIQGFRIETEFLGINHNVTESGPPLWFETMVYRESVQGNHGLKIEYGTVFYSTVAEAIAGHAAICEKLRRGEIRE
jgi:hypothetical protein